MPEIEIDAQGAYELLSYVVFEVGGDYVYPLANGVGRCVYQENGAPSCMVGKALFVAGVSSAELVALDAADLAGIRDVALPERVSITRQARSVLAAAQDAQDNGIEYESALDAAYVELMDFAGHDYEFPNYDD